MEVFQMDKMPCFNNFVFQNIYIFMYDLSWTDCLVAKMRLRTDPCISQDLVVSPCGRRCPQHQGVHLPHWGRSGLTTLTLQCLGIQRLEYSIILQVYQL